MNFLQTKTNNNNNNNNRLLYNQRHCPYYHPHPQQQQQQQQQKVVSSSFWKTYFALLFWLVLAILVYDSNSLILFGVEGFVSVTAITTTTKSTKATKTTRKRKTSSLSSSTSLPISTIITRSPRGGGGSGDGVDNNNNNNNNNSVVENQQETSSTIGGDNTFVIDSNNNNNNILFDSNQLEQQQQELQSVIASAGPSIIRQVPTPPTSTTTSMTTTTSSSLSLSKRIRDTIFPIYGNTEVAKFLLLGTIKFFVILALTLTRDCKDTLIVTQCGAEAIAFLKIYGVLPAATAYIALYSKMSDLLPNKQSLFYWTCIPFFIFFAIFDWFIYPNTHLLHPSILTVQQYIKGTGGMAILANIISNWTYALFYIIAEIYSSVSVGLLFWQYANDVVSIDQAKRFYPLFAQMSGIAPVVAGQYVVRYASTASNFQHSLHRLTNAVSLAGIMICIFYQYSRTFLQKSEGMVEREGGSKKKKKAKMSMMESAKFLASSQYLRLIASLVVGYGLSINFTEIMWKSLVKKQYPDPLQYQRFMGQFSSVVGLSTCIVIFFGVQVIRLLGWRIGAMATPGVMAAVSIPFFACVLWPGSSVDSSPARLKTAVIFGTLNSLLSKTAKYALFDPTTQMAYIPLDEDSKIKGKAAIDVLGSRVGKSGGSFVQQGLVLFFGNILQASPVVCMLYYGVLGVWMNAAHQLSGLFHTAQHEMQQSEDEKKKHEDKEVKQQQQQEESTPMEVKKNAVRKNKKL